MDEKLRESSLTINIEESILNDVLNRVKNSRIISDFGNKEWKYGTEETYLKDLIEYWSNNYDWKKQEKRNK